MFKIVLANVLYSKPRYIDHELPQYYGTYKAYVKAPSHLSEVLRTFLHNYCSVTNEGAYTVTDRVVKRSYKTVFRLQSNKPPPNRLFRVSVNYSSLSFDHALILKFLSEFRY